MHIPTEQIGKIEFDISPYATNAGVAQTDGQSTFATLVNKNNYPTFTVVQTPLEFIVGESLFIKSGNTYTEVDLVVTNNLNDAIKVYGTYELSSHARDLVTKIQPQKRGGEREDLSRPLCRHGKRVL